MIDLASKSSNIRSADEERPGYCTLVPTAATFACLREFSYF